MSNRESRPLRLVVIGGGSGVSQVLLGARASFDGLTGVITVTDTGRSTGVARAIAAMPAPGDLRNTLAALAREPDSLLARLMQHRFCSPAVPALDGMAFGNLMIAALTQLTGDFGEAVETVSQLLGCTARILPVSTVDAQLCAEREDGSAAEDELAVRAVGQAPLRRLYLSPPDAPANPDVLEAIAEADVVALGPGSFFTSVMATLLFDGLVAALRQTRAAVAFICNTTTQPGQTDGFSLLDHVRRLVDLLGPGTLDAALISRSEQISPHVVAQYAADGLHLLHPSDDQLAAIAALGVAPLVRDLTEVTTSKRTLWNKQDTIRHDPALIGMALLKIALDRAG
ncbi:MAG: YvcK family protein [Chloroflexales bacterium]|nr:YvcK family protein [Chloroflexales bacterium]